MRSHTNEPVRRARFAPFRSLDDDARRDHLAHYLAFMRELDGEVDPEGRKLAARERQFEDLAGKRPESAVGLDLQGFWSQLGIAVEPVRDLDPRTAWLVVAAKANTGECHGVEREFAWLTARGAIPTADEIYLRLLMQERYHTRALIECCHTAGLVDVNLPRPNWNQRLFIDLAVRLPDRLRWSLVICGEVVGCAVFKSLLDRCDVFGDEPEVEARLRQLVGEILRDEALHVAYLRARLGPRGLALARALWPVVSRGALMDLPQLTSIGLSREQVLATPWTGIEVPAEAHWMEGDRLAA